MKILDYYRTSPRFDHESGNDVEDLVDDLNWVLNEIRFLNQI